MSPGFCKRAGNKQCDQGLVPTYWYPIRYYQATRALLCVVKIIYILSYVLCNRRLDALVWRQFYSCGVGSDMTRPTSVKPSICLDSLNRSWWYIFYLMSIFCQIFAMYE